MAPLIDDLPGYRPERDPYAWCRTAPLWMVILWALLPGAWIALWLWLLWESF